MPVSPEDLASTLSRLEEGDVTEWHDHATALVRLRQDLHEDRDAMRQCERELHQALRPDRTDPTLAGVALHWWFTSLEILAERVATRLDGDPPPAADAPERLFAALAQERPGVRPGVLPPACLPDLEALRRFRRVFREGYAGPFDEAAIREEAARLERLKPALCEAFDDLDAFLERAISEVLAA